MLISIITPTYNRADTLHRCFESLQAQTFPHEQFEWVVVDDGSQDGTADLVQSWQGQSRFPIRFFKKKNGGKPSAVNLGVKCAEGSLIAILDSDDGVLPSGLKDMADAWHAIPLAERDAYWTIIALCRNAKTKEVVGDSFPVEPLDATWADLVFRTPVNGEKWGLMRADLLKANPYPEGAGYKFVPESFIWARLGRRYLYRCINAVVRDYYMPEGAALGNLSGRANNLRNAAGVVMNDIVTFNEDFPQYFGHARMFFCIRAAQLVRYSLHSGGIAENIRQLRTWRARALVLLGAPVGIAVYVRDVVWLRATYEHARKKLAFDTVA